MRLDRFLKVSRLVKRRTVAKEVCEQGRVQVNGRVAKPGTDVHPGDILVLPKGQRFLELEILAVPEQIAAREAVSTYRVIREERESVGEEDW